VAIDCRMVHIRCPCTVKFIFDVPALWGGIDGLLLTWGARPCTLNDRHGLSSTTALIIKQRFAAPALPSPTYRLRLLQNKSLHHGRPFAQKFRKPIFSNIPLTTIHVYTYPIVTGPSLVHRSAGSRGGFVIRISQSTNLRDIRFG
jgi:hypothetical protein